MSCSAPARIDLDYLIRYTNAPWLVIDAPGTADTVCSRGTDGNPLAWSRRPAAWPQRDKAGDLIRDADRRAGAA
jgi:hypothetical protein